MFHHGATESTALYFFIQPGDTILWLWERLPAAITKEALERLFSWLEATATTDC